MFVFNCVTVVLVIYLLTDYILAKPICRVLRSLAGKTKWGIREADQSWIWSSAFNSFFTYCTPVIMIDKIWEIRREIFTWEYIIIEGARP